MDLKWLRSGWVSWVPRAALLAFVGLVWVTGCGTTGPATGPSSAGPSRDGLSGDEWVRAVFEDEMTDRAAAERAFAARLASSQGGGGLEPQEEDEDDIDSLLEELTRDDADEPAEDDSGAATTPEESQDGVEMPEEDAGEAFDLEPEEEERPVAPRTSPPAPARAGAGELIRRLGLSREARAEQAKELVRQAEVHKNNAELFKAEAALEEALSLDPDSLDAQRELAEVRLLLGDPRGLVSSQIRDIRERERVARDQTRVEIQRLISAGSRYAREEQYSRAIQNYERALEEIRNFPFDLNLDELEREVSVGLEKLKERKRLYEENERREFVEMVNDQTMRERAEDLRIVENKLRQLRRKARAAEEAEDFARAISLYERILTVSPRDKDAAARLEVAKESRHLHRLASLRQRFVDDYDLAILGIEESSVIYQQIFRYPDTEEWLRLRPKIVSIEETIAAGETEAEKEIKRRLAGIQSLSFEQETPFIDVLRTLRDISQINFVLTRDGAAAEQETIQLAQYDNLPLENLLRLILQQITAKTGGEAYGYAIKEGAVLIGPRDSLDLREYLYFYDISDLISSRPDYRAPALALDALAGKTSSEGALLDLGVDEEVATDGLGREKLLELIQKELSGAGEDGATETGISMLAGKLAARTTLENHVKLAQLLDQFRKSTGAMITVESRFLDIQDNFLEDIGVNFGSGGNTFLPNTIPDIDGAGTSVSPGFEYVNPQGDYNSRIASIGEISTPIGSAVNPFNLSGEGGGAYQLNVLRAERFQLEALLVGVAKEQEIRRLSSPRVTAFNGQTSHTLVVEQSAYIQDLEVNQTGVIPVINPVIGVLNSGSILEVRPTLSYDRKYVVLEIQPTLAEQLESDVAVLNLSGSFTVVPVELPVLSVTKIKTTVTVPDGGTVLVGGLKREITTKTQIGVPGLLDIPLVNLIFGRRAVSTVRSSLFVLINAKVTVVHEEEARLFGTEA